MTKDKELKDLFLDTLKDIYFAEKKILSALPKMAKAAQSPKLKAAFEKHMGETEGQVDRLEQVFASIDESPKGKTCDAIMGILDEGKEVMDEYKGTSALDAGLLAAAQAVEHYEISRYGTLKTWGNELGYRDAVKLLDATLKEEKNTDSALTQIAESEVNLHAETAEAACRAKGCGGGQDGGGPRPNPRLDEFAARLHRRQRPFRGNGLSFRPQGARGRFW